MKTKMKKNINIIFAAKLGDGLCLTPVIRILNQSWYKINLFCSEYNKVIFKDSPYVSNLISLPWGIFKNFRFPVLPKFWSIFRLCLWQIGKFKEFKNLPTFVINENIQGYIFWKILSKNVFYKDPVYHFLWWNEIKTKKRQFSYQILEFFEKSLNEKFDISKDEFKYELFWKDVNENILKDKIEIKEWFDFKNLILFNLSATLDEKELTIEENIRYIEQLLKDWKRILIIDKNLQRDKYLKIKKYFKNFEKIFFLKQPLNLFEIYTLSKKIVEYWWPDSWISHLISINCPNCNIFFTKNNRVEKVWLPLQNSKAIIV